MEPGPLDLNSCYPYGVDATTGQVVLPRIDLNALAANLASRGPRAAGVDPGEEALAAAEAAKREGHLAAEPGVVLDDLASAGWAAVFPVDADSSIEKALEPLLELRRSQAQARFRVVHGPEGYRPGEHGTDFLGRFGGARLVKPAMLPYYLMLIGDPGVIPYDVERVLATQYAVGRLDLATPEDYARYATGVLAHESAQERDQNLCFFAPQNPGDGATPLSRAYLIEPLAARFAGAHPVLKTGTQATKPALRAMLGDAAAPRLVVTATHGLFCELGSDRQRERQGALLCQEWDARVPKPVPDEVCFGGDDVDAELDLGGAIALLFGCYSAGTPLVDRYWLTETGPIERKTLADPPFVAHLARRALGHAKPALAIVGHVERTFGSAFYRDATGSSTPTFENFITRLRNGERLGQCMRGFVEDAATDLVQYDVLQEQVLYGRPPGPDLALTWLQSRDASAFVIVGDPAIRLVPPS